MDHLEHKNIIPVPYLEMEFVQGLKTETGLYKSLDELEKPLNEKLAVHFVRKTAEGLLYAHKKGDCPQRSQAEEHTARGL